MSDRKGDAFLLGAGGFVVALGAALGLVRFIGRYPAEPAVEAVLASVALGGVLAAPGVLTLVARVGRPALLLPAGVALVPLSFLAFSGVTLPLLIPAVLLLVAYRRRATRSRPPLMPGAVTIVVVLSCLVAAVFALFAHPDPRSYTTPTGGGGTSDVVTVAESLGALALVGAAIVLGRALTTPGDQ